MNAPGCRMLLLAILSCAPLAPDAAQRIDVSALPEKVVKAVRHRFPQGQLLGAEKEVQGRKVLYEVEVRHEGRVYDVELTPDGRIIETELDDGEDDD